ALAELVMRCLAKEPADRPQSAAEIGVALDAVVTGQSAAMPAMLLSGPGAIRRALLFYVLIFAAVALVAKAAVVAFGLPDWVFTAAVILMSAGLPVVLATASVHHTVRRVATRTPVLTGGGTPVAHGTMATMALKAHPHLTWQRAMRGGAVAIGAFAAAVIAI